MMTKTLLILIDGCRTDMLAAARTPAIDKLRERGAWTYRARTVTPSVTLPVHFSIFTAMTPVNHGVLSNAANPNVSNSAVSLPQWLRAAGKATAMYYNWEYLRELTPPGCLDRSFYVDTATDPDGDMAVARLAAADITDTFPDFSFVYLGCLDEAGHAGGYESETYRACLERADRAVAFLVTALENAGLADSCTILLQSDHGGIGYNHEDPLPEVMEVPWILAGPGVAPGEIRIPGDAPPVSVTDTAPTLLRCMGVAPPTVWQGRVVREAFRTESLSAGIRGCKQAPA